MSQRIFIFDAKCSRPADAQFYRGGHQSPVASLDLVLAQGLLRLHMDTNPEVRKLVCQAFVMLVEIRADYLQPRIRDVIERLLWSTENDPEHEVWNQQE